MQPSRACAFLNPYVEGLLPLGLADCQPAPGALLHGCLIADKRLPAPAPASASAGGGLLTHYLLDLASVVCARMLPVTAGSRVLDMCAGPGGKMLVLSQSLGAGGLLVANEPSGRRRARLAMVSQQYLPRSSGVHVAAYEGQVFGRAQPGFYDSVLVDAPCSSDRHLLGNESELEEWGPRRPRTMAARQLKLLQSAVHTVRPGGHVLYSTCALSPEENDGVVSQLLAKCKKRGWTVDVCPPIVTVPMGAPTEHGWLILPDEPGQWGPMYFSLLQRRFSAGDGAVPPPASGGA